MLRSTAAVALGLSLSSIAWGIGWGSLGNEPFKDHNYKDWPNVMPVINDTHRVGHVWVNGNEHFYFAGDTGALNAALKNFATIRADKLVVVLRPAPGIAKTFFSEKPIEFNWNLHLLGGISKHMAKEELARNIWDPNPYMHVYVGDAIQLDAVEIPSGVVVVEIADLQNRYVRCLSSSDRTVRGWSCSEIARLDPYYAESMEKVAAKLHDDDDWVKLNAAGALSLFTGVPRDAIEKLEAVKTNNDELQKRIQQSIDVLHSTKPNEVARQQFQQSLTAIHAFVVKM